MKNILSKISKRIEEQSKLYVRGHKGGGTGHAYTSKKSTNLGSSLFDNKESKEDISVETGPVKVSRAFKT